ncbi:T9SS type A sorting domain-containing protein [Gracilimonas tropica]|uniref:T9SS type A sorting domain-containing protein n=1 Tax=Gracilimonas tropica TaxID=454600 RepID=UPI00035EB60F|nr:T9SS type A sorting domain-containing protein [Gracilimonas tropica]
MKSSLLALSLVLAVVCFSGTVRAQGTAPVTSLSDIYYPGDIDIMWQLEQSQEPEILIGSTQNYDDATSKYLGIIYLFQKEYGDTFDLKLNVVDSAIVYNGDFSTNNAFSYLPPYIFVRDTVLMVDGSSLIGVPNSLETERLCLIYCDGGNTAGSLAYEEFITYDDSTIIALEQRYEFDQAYLDIIRLRNRNGNLIATDTIYTADSLPYFVSSDYAYSRESDFWYVPLFTQFTNGLLKVNLNTLEYEFLPNLPTAGNRPFKVLNDTLYLAADNNRIDLYDLKTESFTGISIDESQVRATHPSYGRAGNELYNPSSYFFPNLVTDSLRIYGGLEVVWDPLKSAWIYTGKDYNPDELVYHEYPYFFFRTKFQNSKDYRTGTYEVNPVYAFSSEPSYVNGLFLLRDYLGNSFNLNPSLISFRAREDGQMISTSESFFTFEPVENVPVDFRMVMMIDNSFSVGAELPELKEAAVEVIQQLPEDLEIALYSFSGSTQLLVDYTSDKAALAQAVNSITLGGTTTNLHGSMITGLSRWENSYSDTGLQLGSMIVITDGEDTQGTNSAQDVLDARGDKQIITIKIGNSSTVIEDFGNAGSFRFQNFSALLNGIDVIIKRLNEDAQNLMWFSYASPKRGDQDRVFSLEILGWFNLNSYSRDAGLFSNILELRYNSANFSDIIPGVYVNRSVYDTDGLNSIKALPGDSLLLQAFTLLPIFPEQHTFELQEPINPGLSIRIFEEDSSQAYLHFEPGIQLDGSDTLIVRDEGNSYTRKIPIEANLITSNEEIRENPERFELTQNYPNPFNPVTRIHYSLPVNGKVRLEVRNILGQLVSTLVDQPQMAGSYSVMFDGSSLSSGVYFYSLKAGDKTQTKRMTLIK